MLILIGLTIKALKKNNQFSQIFKGIMEYRCVPASSFSGYLWQLYLESYSIPGRYKNLIKLISTPDPQTGDC